MKLQEIIRNILLEEFDPERKQRIFDKIVNILTNSISVKTKGNKLIFWYMSDQINEPIFEYNKRTNTLTILKGQVRNFLDIYIPESMGKDFRYSVLKKVFTNLASSLLKLDKIQYEI